MEGQQEAAGQAAGRAERGGRPASAMLAVDHCHGALLTTAVRGGLLDRLADAHIGAAAADVARHRGVDIGIVGIGRRGEQRRGRHDLAGLAIAALHDFEVEPGLLHLGAGGRRADAFDGGDRAVADRADRQHAGAHRLAVDMHGAGAALRDAAAEFRAGHAEHIAQHPEQRHVGGRVEGFVFAVDCQRRCHDAPPEFDGRGQRTRWRSPHRLYRSDPNYERRNSFAMLLCLRCRTWISMVITQSCFRLPTPGLRHAQLRGNCTPAGHRIGCGQIVATLADVPVRRGKGADFSSEPPFSCAARRICKDQPAERADSPQNELVAWMMAVVD